MAASSLIPPVIRRKLSSLPRFKLAIFPAIRRHKRRYSTSRHSTRSNAAASASPKVPASHPDSTLAAVFQRLPIILHSIVALLAVFGPVYWPAAISALFFITQVMFVSSQVRTAWGMYQCWRFTRRHSQTDWYTFYVTRANPTSPSHHPDILPITSVEHVILLPNYKETLGTLRESLSVLASHPLARTSYRVCLAMEERELGAPEKAALLIAEYADMFLDMAFALHPAGIPSEAAGKSSNVSFASRFMAARTIQVDPQALTRQVITVMDADTAFASDFFLCISAKFALAKPDIRERMHFAVPMVFDRNAKDVPVFTRVTDIFWASAGAGGIYPGASVKIPTSAYALSMSLAVYVDFWDTGPEAIGEDMHMFCKCLFDTKGHVVSETIYSPASQSNVVGSPSKNAFWQFLNDMMARWTQATRHMWGSLDTGYIWRRLVTRDFGVTSKDAHRALIQLPIDDTSDAVSLTSNDGQHASDDYSSDDETQSAYGLCAPPTYTTISSASSVTAVSTDREGRPPTPDTPFIPKGPYTPSHLPPARWKAQPIRVWPFVALVVRLYEAHIMLAHLSILTAVLSLYPTAIISNGEFSVFQWPFSAPNVVSAFLSDPVGMLKNPATNGTALMFRAAQKGANAHGTGSGFLSAPLLGDALDGASKTIYWAMPNTVRNAITFSQRFGLIGVIASVLMCIFHDLYHREAATTRWRNSARAEAEYNAEHGDDASPILSSASSQITLAGPGVSMLPKSDLAAALGAEALTGHKHPSMLSGHDFDLEGGAYAPPFNSRYLGIRSAQVYERHWPWALLDYLAVPGALVYGFAPLVLAQFRQIWTNRLTYTVSHKPTMGGAGASTAAAVAQAAGGSPTTVGAAVAGVGAGVQAMAQPQPQQQPKKSGLGMFPPAPVTAE